MFNNESENFGFQVWQLTVKIIDVNAKVTQPGIIGNMVLFYHTKLYSEVIEIYYNALI